MSTPRIRHSRNVPIVTGPLDEKSPIKMILDDIDRALLAINEDTPTEIYNKTAKTIEALMSKAIDDSLMNNLEMQQYAAERAQKIAKKITDIVEKNPEFANIEAFQKMMGYWYAQFKHEYIEFKDVSKAMKEARLQIEKDVM